MIASCYLDVHGAIGCTITSKQFQEKHCSELSRQRGGAGFAARQDMLAQSPRSLTGSEAEGAGEFRAAEEEFRRRRSVRAPPLYDAAEQEGYDCDACDAGRWNCHMLLGDFEAAWKESDAIARRGNPDPNRFWTGIPLAGQDVMLRCLHGLGDTIQFLRYAPLIKREARTLTIEAQPALEKLIQNCGLADNVITWGEPEPPWSVQLEVMELLRVFRTVVTSIPNEMPYLRMQPTEKTVMSRQLQVALVWASSRFNPARSIPLEALAGICDVAGCDFFSLGGEPKRGELLDTGRAFRDMYDRTNCPLRAAKTLLMMDLLITVDTMMAHLAGALGVRVWTLLHHAADWRWLLERRDSPWYPTLFRQAKAGD
jgi:hypothetical protein